VVGSAKSEYRKIRTNCQNVIQEGLGESIYSMMSLEHMLTSVLAKILKDTDASSLDSPMNYTHYEDKIVESFGVALDRWPLRSCVCNPDTLSSSNMNTLWKALAYTVCKWVALTPEELSARKIDNQHQVANGEEVYGPPWKQRVQNVAPCDGGDDISNDNE